MSTRRYFKTVGWMALCLLFAVPLAFAELPEGTVIKASNLDSLLDETFEGHAIKNLIPEKLQWMIREKGLTMELVHSKAWPVDPRWTEATQKYAKDVTYDPKTRNVSGYKAGLAFPDIADNDPDKAMKLMWNLYFTGGWPRPEFHYIPKFAYLMIDGDKGVERNMVWGYMRVHLAGRLNGDPVVGDKGIYYKQLLLAREPYDIRGVGTLRIRYTGGDRGDDGWAYVRSVRRTRRLSGGAWMDPIGGTDQLNDEISVYSPYPTWFPKYNYLGKRHILAVANGKGVAWQADNPSNPFPYIDLQNAPYWNPKNNWEPREVHVVEAIMPEEHPYSRRVYYFDANGWIPYFGECYDKKGEFVKMLMNDARPIVGMDGKTSYGVEESQGYAIDFKRNHATIFSQGKISKRNPPGMGPDDVTLGVMEAIAQGKWKEPVFD